MEFVYIDFSYHRTANIKLKYCFTTFNSTKWWIKIYFYRMYPLLNMNRRSYVAKRLAATLGTPNSLCFILWITEDIMWSALFLG